MIYKLNAKGETIVEVLISMTVIAATLAGAYYVLNNSFKQNQASLDRVAGLKAVESKIEILRTLPRASVEGAASVGAFCVSDTGVVAYNSASPAPSCKVGRNTVTVTRNATLDSYEVKAEWDGLTIDKERAVIYYKL